MQSVQIKSIFFSQESAILQIIYEMCTNEKQKITSNSHDLVNVFFFLWDEIYNNNTYVVVTIQGVRSIRQFFFVGYKSSSASTILQLPRSCRYALINRLFSSKVNSPHTHTYNFYVQNSTIRRRKFCSFSCFFFFVNI